MDKLLLRPDEAAAMLGISRSKAYAMLQSGELPSVRVGNTTRVPVAELRGWVVDRLERRGEGSSTRDGE